MRRKDLDSSLAQRPRRAVLALLLIGVGCSNSAGSRPKFTASNEYAQRSTGCIDTPLIGPDVRRSSGVQCGREAPPNALVVRGRVVSETVAGLPGAGLEDLWVSIHPIDRSSDLARLPPPTVETETGPQGAFAVSLTRVGEWLITVRAEPGGPVLAARRIEAGPDAVLPELILLIPRGEQAALDPADASAPAPDRQSPQP